jgi:hypothetical protein
MSRNSVIPRIGSRLVLLLAGILAACSDADSPTVAAPQTDPQVEQLVAMGARRDQILDRGDHFVVEGDIRVYKKNLRRARLVAAPDGKARPGDPSLQRYVSTVAPNRRVIRVDLSAVEAVNASWAAATRAAMSNWSAVPGSYISFVEGGGPIDITVSFVGSLGGCTVAQGDWPASGAPGSTVQISQAYMNSYGYPKQVWIMTHELGHNIGFAHTDQSSFGTIVPGTPSSSDGGSVMNSGNTYQGCPPAAPDWSWFSSYDQVAMRYLYPVPPPDGLTVSHPASSVVLSWNAVGGASHYEIQYVAIFRSDDYERGSSSTVSESGWSLPIYSTSTDTGSQWTGVSTCEWINTMYTSERTYYYWEVRAVFPHGGATTAAWVGAEDATC